jgi:plasmid maintenance system antidote protein VapI
MQEIKDRIIHLMKTKNINATQLAETLNIQRSGISHILSGRNKPGTDFIIKLKESFPEFSLDWLLLGKGPATISPSTTEKADTTVRKAATQVSLFDFGDDVRAESGETDLKVEHNSTLSDPLEASVVQSAEKVSAHISGKNENPPLEKGENKKLVKLIFVYSDNTFSALNPSD